jgi:hypothetical protein
LHVFVSAGVPSGLRFMPGLMEAVKGAVRREAAQLLDKVHYVASKVRGEWTIQLLFCIS